MSGSDRQSPIDLTSPDVDRDEERMADEARLLFDRPAPEGYLDDWAEVLARPESMTVADEIPMLVFRIGGEWLAMPTAVLVEVAEPRPIHRVPHRIGGLLRGLVNIRGRLTPCVELGRLLAIEGPPRPAMAEQTGRIVVAEAPRGAGRIAFQVVEVAGVLQVGGDQLRGVPATLERTDGHCRATFRWRDRAVGVLDDRHLFHALESFDR